MKSITGLTTQHIEPSYDHSENLELVQCYNESNNNHQSETQ